jgi:hypothetical protein
LVAGTGWGLAAGLLVTVLVLAIPNRREPDATPESTEPTTFTAASKPRDSAVNEVGVDRSEPPLPKEAITAPSPPAAPPQQGPGLPPSAVAATPEVGLEIGDQAPEIEGTDLDGKRFRLGDYRGKVVVLDFWASW